MFLLFSHSLLQRCSRPQLTLLPPADTPRFAPFWSNTRGNLPFDSSARKWMPAVALRAAPPRRPALKTNRDRAGAVCPAAAVRQEPHVSPRPPRSVRANLRCWRPAAPPPRLWSRRPRRGRRAGAGAATEGAGCRTASPSASFCRRRSSAPRARPTRAAAAPTRPSP